MNGPLTGVVRIVVPDDHAMLGRSPYAIGVLSQDVAGDALPTGPEQIDVRVELLGRNLEVSSFGRMRRVGGVGGCLCRRERPFA